MPKGTVRVYAELNRLLPPHRRFREQRWDLPGPATVAEVLGVVGVPMDEVDVVLVDGEPALPEDPLYDGARVSVYPVFESLDVGALRRPHASPLRRTAFFAGPGLGALCRLLRGLGFDCDTFGGGDDPGAVVARAGAERRVILTRDADLLARPGVERAFLVPAGRAEAQAALVLRRFDLAAAIAPLTRCVACNGVLEECAPGSDCRRCTACGRIYGDDAARRLRDRATSLAARSEP